MEQGIPMGGALLQATKLQHGDCLFANGFGQPRVLSFLFFLYQKSVTKLPGMLARSSARSGSWPEQKLGWMAACAAFPPAC